MTTLKEKQKNRTNHPYQMATKTKRRKKNSMREIPTQKDVKWREKKLTKKPEPGCQSEDRKIRRIQFKGKFKGKTFKKRQRKRHKGVANWWSRQGTEREVNHFLVGCYMQINYNLSTQLTKIFNEHLCSSWWIRIFSLRLSLRWWK